jgi:hypothetical protein
MSSLCADLHLRMLDSMGPFRAQTSVRPVLEEGGGTVPPTVASA